MIITSYMYYKQSAARRSLSIFILTYMYMFIIGSPTRIWISTTRLPHNHQYCRLLNEQCIFMCLYKMIATLIVETNYTRLYIVKTLPGSYCVLFSSISKQWFFFFFLSHVKFVFLLSYD